jgi:hypothetical protein
LRNVVKKSDHFFGAVLAGPIQIIHQGVARRGMCPLLFVRGGFSVKMAIFHNMLMGERVN